MTLEERFWSKVKIGETNQCWEWMTYIWPDGYARFAVGHRMQLAHRVSYTINVGAIPDGLCILHRCDNRSCVNPAHLFLGTQQDNIKDCANKGRFARGERIGASKLTNYQVVEIKRSLARGLAIRAIARQFDVMPYTIRQIRDRKSWNHIKLQ